MGQRNGNTVTFEGWSGGEYGILDPVQAGKAKKQMFTGNNVMLYRNGLLGPRPGLKALDVDNGAFLNTGVMHGLDACLATGTGPWIWTSVDGDVQRIDLGTGIATSNYSGGPLATPVRAIPIGGSYGTGTIIQIPFTGLFNLDHSGDAISSVDTDPNGYAIGQFGIRIVAGDSGNSMWYADPAPAYATWGALSFYDIGSAFTITLLRAFRDGILIGKIGGEVYYGAGTLGDTFTLKRLSAKGAPGDEPRGLVTEANVMWYMRQNTPYLSSFNGSVHEDFEWLLPFGSGLLSDFDATPKVRIVGLPHMGTDAFMVIGGATGSGRPSVANRMMQYNDSTFSYHTFGKTIGAFGTDFGPSTPWVVIADDGSGGVFYSYAPGKDRPAFTSDTDAGVGDDSTTPLDAYMQTPIYVDPEGHEMRVKQVIIDYKGWSTGAAANNNITLTVDSMYRYDNDSSTFGETTSTSVTALDEAGATFTTSGKTGRVVHNVNCGFGGGFQIKCASLKGVAIRSITAVFDVRNRRP